MSLQERAKAAAKNVEGKIEEAIGNITNDPEKQAEAQAKQVEADVRNASEDVKDKAKDVADVVIAALAGAARFHHGGGEALFFLDVEAAHELGRVADVLAGLAVFLDQHVEHTQVTPNGGVGGLGQQVADLWLALLAIAVDAAISLLEHHQRPRDVEVHHAVAEVVQVDAL